MKSTERFSFSESLNFLLTNRIPRRLLTRLMGWYSQIRNPWLASLSIKVWRWFAPDLDLSESVEQRYRSLHDCFIRQLKPGAREIDHRDGVLISPCDAIVGACGQVQDGQLFQAKGYPYQLKDLLPDADLQQRYRNASYVTLRLKSSFYHHFHAPLNAAVNTVTYISGDTWNVNPVALKRVEALFCKNERAVIDLVLDQSDRYVTLVPVAAILVASMKFNFLDYPLDMRYRGPNEIDCHGEFKKGDDMGYFQHGSTIIVFASEPYALAEGIQEGVRINMGEALLFDKKQVEV